MNAPQVPQRDALPEPAGTGAAVHVDPAPFDLPGDGNAAALCLHGLTGTPYEVRPLGEALAAHGVAARGPALPGHNETPERLARVGHEEWLACARANLRELSDRYERVFVAGVSLGGLIALWIASEERVDALVTIGTPLELSRPVRWLVPWVKYLRGFAPKPAGSDIRDPEARARHPSYPRMPLRSVHELVKLQRRVRGRLSRVTAPIFVAHGALDRTASPADAARIHASVASERRRLRSFERSGHVVTVDHDGPELIRDAVDFLRGAGGGWDPAADAR
ncbi:MAG: alpha/beta fold hydrolase [Deltaproteobacteria bacterium]|nr:MAG: alpha/beta fold hydrolase [Deltaproteobacteria bacterium]